MDSTSKAIIEQLQKDGRKSYSEVGKLVGLSETATRGRVQKLIESGSMQIVAVTDPLRLGFFRQAMLGIQVNGDVEQVAEHLERMSEVTYVVLTAGSFDLLIEVVCQNDDDLIHLINSKIKKIEGVRTLETFIYLKLRKQNYNWGTR